MSASLTVVMYHYVRDLPRTQFPQIKGMLTADFARQVQQLNSQFEMATLESALAFLRGNYKPARPMCLLTFDDGLMDHYTDVLPIVAKHRIQGLFFLITGCRENQVVADVHKNHFLMAALEFDDYCRRVLDQLQAIYNGNVPTVNAAEAERKYRWDSPEVAHFKFLLNFGLPTEVRTKVLERTFKDVFGDEAEFSRQLYVNWSHAREMQAAGMSLGGHSHAHHSLGSLTDAEQAADLSECARILQQRLAPQELWPFSYPFGNAGSYNATTMACLRDLKFACSFCTEVGQNEPGRDLFSIRRIDPKDVPACVA